MPLKLRPGSRIQRIVLYFRHTAGSSTGLSLRRAKIDAAEEDINQFAVSYAPTTGGTVTTVESSSPTPHRVQAGWQYDVMVQSNTNDSFVHGVKVYYLPPN